VSASGLLLVDKPRGPTSFDVVARVRKRLGVKKVGHAGTLDPMATGLLPILVGEGTKLVPYLQGLDKVYRASIALGVTTDTYDAEGKVVAVAEAAKLAALTDEEVRGALAGFVGTVKQRPPAFSALKKDGKRLYEMARAGEEVVVEEREVTIAAIAVERIELPAVEVTVQCSKGTYIRSIAHDLGQRLGVGAHLHGLRRTRVGGLSVEGAADPFADRPLPALVPLADAIKHLPSSTIEAEVARKLRMGQQEALASLGTPEGARRLLDREGRLVAVVEAEGGRWALSRIFAENADLR
jgi:tRNA pseudouridine55 synthase